MIMSSRQQLQKFHQHLIAIELAGFRISSQLLQNHEKPEAFGQSEAAMLQMSLEQVAAQVGDHNGDEFMQSLQTRPTVTRIYVSSFQQWLDSQERIASLEHLLTEDNLQYTAKQGLSRSWLHLAIFTALGMLSLTTVWGLSLHGIRDLVGQMRIDPPWALKSLLGLQPYFGWVLAVVAACILLVGWRLTRRAKLAVIHGDALQALKRAQLAGLLSAQLGSNSPSDSTDATPTEASALNSPLLDWVRFEAPKQGLDARNVLGLVQRLYLWMSLDRSQRASIDGPKISSATIGGVIALSAGLLLFYPLIQLLRIVIDTSGLSR
jgi:hypothetical protein